VTLSTKLAGVLSLQTRIVEKMSRFTYVTSSRLPLFSVVLVCAISLAYAALPSHYLQLSPRTKNSAPSSDCQTIADNDLYGKGVRIGLYLQWASGFVLRNLESWETRARVRTNSNILAGAVAVATALNIAHGSALSVDYLLSYYLTVVLFYAESYNMEIKHKENDPEGVKAMRVFADMPLVFQNIIFTSFTLYGGWYWLKGITWTADPVCGARGALLGLFDIRSRAWTRGAAGLAIIAGILFFMVFLVHLATLPKGVGAGAKTVAVHYAKAARAASGGELISWDEISMLKKLLRPSFPLQGFSSRLFIESLVGLIHYFLIYLAGPLIAIVSVERMIVANSLVTASAFGSAGQTIALFTGIVSALLVCWDIIKKRWKISVRDSSDESFQGENVTAHHDSAPSKEPQLKQTSARQMEEIEENIRTGVSEENK
jgi:hypothetical protein